MHICYHLLIILFLLSGCSEDKSPLSAKAQDLNGTWVLPLTQVPKEEFQFSYLFKSNGQVTNKLGGAFLQRLRGLAAAQELDLGSLGTTDQIDGAYLNLNGTWEADGDSLRVLFTEAEVELFGTLPILGRVGVPVHREPLPNEEQVDAHFTCAINGDQLTLRGTTLTAGIRLGENGDPIQLAALGPLGNEALRLAREQLAEVIQQENANQVTLERD